MTVKSLELARWAARSAVAVAFLITTPAVLAQDEASPAPESTETAPPADAAAPAEAAPAEGAAPAEAAPAEGAAAPSPTPEVIPVQTGEAETPPETTKLEAIEVTGSRLKRTDYETAQPVVTISREDIERTGLTDVSQILRHLTVAGNNSLSPQQGRLSLSMGETNLDLRNLGASHTLLLVNGHRWVTGLIPTQPSVSDLNTIPTNIIERIEVLKDGASAVYGSDAIGGVVNIITRKDYEGFGVNMQFGQFIEQRDGTNQQASFSWGFNRPGRSGFVDISYTEQGRAPTGNRPFTATSTPGTGTTRWSFTTERGRFLFIPNQANASEYQCPNLQGGIAADETGVGQLNQTNVIPAGVVLCDLTLIPGMAGGDRTHYRQRIDEDVYNKFLHGSLQEPNKRTAVYGQFSQQLPWDVTFNLDALYNLRESNTVGQNLPLGGGQAFNGALSYIPATNQFNVFAQNIGFEASCGAPPGTPGYDPTGASCAGATEGYGAWLIRLTGDNANWNFVDDVETMRIGGSLKGDFEVIGLPVYWDAGHIFANNEIEEISPLPRTDYEFLALGDPANCTGACVPLDVFHGQAGITQQMLDFVIYDTWQRNDSRQDISYLNSSVEFPALSFLAGPIAMAAGLEMRRDHFESHVDPVVTAGLTILNSQVDTGGTQTAEEAYVEFGIPLMAGRTGFQSLDLDLAGRYSKYPRLDAVTTGKVGLRWQPFDSLLLRTTYSTGFKAPNVGELYLGASQSFDPLSDPCADPTASQTTQDNCAADNVTVAGASSGLEQPYDVWSGNPNLEPETSKNLTYGLIFSPLEDLNFTLDFYKIRIDDFVSIGQGQFFLDSCYTVNPRNYCNNIQRNANGSLHHINTPFFNFSAVETEGIDGRIDFKMALPNEVGIFGAALDVSYLTQYDSIKPRPGLPDEVVREVGKVSGLFAGYPRWKAGSQLTWSRDVWNASWSTRMAYAIKEQCNDIYGDTDPSVSYRALGLCSDPKFNEDGQDISEHKSKTTFYHNVQIGRELPWYNAEVSLGINNVLDQDPPVSYSMVGFYWYNYDPNHHEIPGRFGYLRASFKF